MHLAGNVALVVLSASAATGAGWVAWTGAGRVGDAWRTVDDRHRGDAATGLVQRVREVAAETARPTLTRVVGPAIPDAPVVNERVGAWDEATLAELRREGIELRHAAELRQALAVVLTDPDPAKRRRTAQDVKRRFGLTVTPELLGRLAPVRGTPELTLTERGREFVRGVVASVSAQYDRFVRLLD
jgi:hypothetical protein